MGAGWRAELEGWLEPFLARLSHPAQFTQTRAGPWPPTSSIPRSAKLEARPVVEPRPLRALCCGQALPSRRVETLRDGLGRAGNRRHGRAAR